MPAALSYPGVYVEEIASGVRTITGVATSIAAFVGRTWRGPVDRPVTTTSWDDFVRTFGDLDLDYPLGFAVRDFYLNGGAQAVIARVFSAASAEVAQFDAKGLAIEAASPGDWANTLRVRVTKTDPAKLTDVAKMLGVAPSDLFNLSIHDTKTGVTEDFINLSAAKSSARRVNGILLNKSALARTKAGIDPVDPTGVHGDPAAGKDIWEDDTASTKVTAAVKPSDNLKKAADFGDADKGTGLYLLAQADLFNLLCIPPDTRDGEVPTDLHSIATKFCVDRRALYIADPPNSWTTVASVKPDDLKVSGLNARNAAVYFPRVIQANPLHGGQPENFVPCGTIAGIMARTDVARGVWKAPAGIDASLTGVHGLSVPLNDQQNGVAQSARRQLSAQLPDHRQHRAGARARMRGADMLGDEYKYVPVRRLALFIEESLFRGLKWVVFEPNDEPLWGQIRLNVGAFMHDLFRQGAFQGASPRDAYFVKCDKDTTTQNDINLGIVNIVVGFAPLKPAEFVVLKIQQIAGQIQT